MSSSEVEHRNLALSMRKSVENLVISSQDAIGQSISQALSFSGVISHHQHQIQQPDNRNVSRSPSPCRHALEPSIPESPDDKSDAAGLLARADSVSICSQLELGAALRGGAAMGPRAKKKSWYSALYPTYKSRSDDFKRLFKDLPDDERLIVDYSCALQRDILAHGRLYASQGHLSFYANIFGWETCMCLRWKDVTAITKEKTALVIPNAILVCTDTEKNFLTSFSGRDKAYLMLFRVWQNALMDQQMSSQEIWQWVHSCYGEELGFNSDDDEYARDAPDEDKMAAALRLAADCVSERACVKRKRATMVKVFLLSHKEKKEKKHGDGQIHNDSDYLEASSLEASGGGGGEGGEDAVSSASLPTATSEHPVFTRSNSQPPPITLTPPLKVAEEGYGGGGGGVGGGGGAEEAGDALPTDMSDSSDSDRDKHVGGGGGGGGSRCLDKHEGRGILQLDVAVNIDQLFTMLFTNSKFCLELLATRNTGDYIQSVWKHNPETGLKCRQVSYTLALTQPIGPKSVHVTETQVMNKCSKPGQVYSIDISSVNAGVPYADSFYVIIHYCLQRRGEQLTSLALYCSIKYKKTVWGIVKGFIEKNTWTGLEDYCRMLEAALLSETDGDRAQTKRKGKRRRRATSSSQETSAPNASRSPAAAVSGAGAPRASASRAAAAAPAPAADRAGARWLLGILLLLLILNLLLYWKLYHAQAPPYLIDRAHFHDHVGELSAELAAEWGEQLERATHRRRGQLHAWRDALRRAIHTLKQTEQALAKLLDTIRPSLEQAQAEAEAEPAPAPAPPQHGDL